MKPISSAITGTLLPALKAGSATGSPHGEPGSAMASNGAPPAEMHPEVMRRDPSINTDAVQSRLRQFGVNLTVKTSLTFPSDQGATISWRERVTGADLSLSSSADLRAALRVVEESLAPAPLERIEHWIAEVNAITARRGETAAEAELALTAYSSRLRQYPGDIVRDTLLSWGGKWFPTWGELKEILDVRTSPRTQMLLALKVPGVPGGNKHPAINLTGKTAEQRYELLMKEAHFARRSDPERAKELEDQAIEELALAREEERAKQEH